MFRWLDTFRRVGLTRRPLRGNPGVLVGMVVSTRFYADTGISDSNDNGSRLDGGKRRGRRRAHLLQKNDDDDGDVEDEEHSNMLDRATYQQHMERDTDDILADYQVPFVDHYWRTLLELPARAAWQVTLNDITAPSVGNMFRRKYLQRIYHDRIVNHHAKLAKSREEERLRHWRGRGEGPKSKQLQPVCYGREEAWASVHFRWHGNYAVTRRVLEETVALTGVKPRRMMDFGIGFGAATSAALELFPDIEWIHGIEPSETMREAAEHFIPKPRPRLTFSSYLSATQSATPFDLVLCAYTLCEMTSARAVFTAAAILWEKVAPNGVLVLIEPGTPDGFASIRAARNLLLDADPDEAYIIAPCTHNGPCPVQRFVKKLRKHHGASYETETGNEEDNLNEESNDAHNNDGVDARDFDEFEADDNGHDEEAEDYENESDEYSNEDYDEANENEENEEFSDEGDEEYEENDESEEHDQEGESESTGYEAEELETKVGYCSFVQSLSPRDGNNKSEKFSYLVIQKKAVPKEEPIGPLSDLLEHTVQSAINLQEDPDYLENGGMEHHGDLLTHAKQLEWQYLNQDKDEESLGLEILRDERSRFARILQRPAKKKGHIFIECCAPPGRVVRYKLRKSMSSTIPGIYAAARKSRWGGFWPALRDLEG